MSEQRILVASNRGPVAFFEQDGELVARRGAGGLVTALTGVVQRTGGLWIAAAMSEDDRARLRSTPDGRLDVSDGEIKLQLRLLDFDEALYDRAYNGVSNGLLWFLHHYLWDLPRMPVIDHETWAAWSAYREYNGAFARALSDEVTDEGCAVLVQDYHLSLAPAALRALRPTARIAHFHHSPFAGMDYLRLLPPVLVEELLRGLLGADVLGFHTQRWADNFLRCCTLLESADVDADARVVTWNGRTVRVGVYPISIDATALELEAASDAVARRRADLERWRGDRLLLLRVDRAELSKNVLRGFVAFAELLRSRPEWRRRVVFLALLTPSRQDVPGYSAYLDECLTAAQRVNEELGEPGWTPIETRVEDDFAEVLAAYQIYDALLVNPLLDGMNLVAKEGALLNRRDGALVLSRNAGAFAELGDDAIAVDPLDVAGTAEAIDRALGMGQTDREMRARRLRKSVKRRTPRSWVDAQLEDLSSR